MHKLIADFIYVVLYFNNKMRLIPLLILISVAFSDNTVTMKCGSCSSGIADTCIWFEGAGLSNQKFPYVVGCRGFRPATYTLTCTPSCPNGCELKYTTANLPEIK